MKKIFGMFLLLGATIFAENTISDTNSKAVIEGLGADKVKKVTEPYTYYTATKGDKVVGYAYYSDDLKITAKGMEGMVPIFCSIR